MKTTPPPVQITGFSVTRQVWGHGESGYAITVNVDKLSGYDYASEAKVRKVVEELNESLKTETTNAAMSSKCNSNPT